MKFLILPYYPFCLPAEEATNGSPNRRRDSGESPFVDVSTTWLRWVSLSLLMFLSRKKKMKE